MYHPLNFILSNNEDEAFCTFWILLRDSVSHIFPLVFVFRFIDKEGGHGHDRMIV